jgi:DNA-binding response OmpR family regulator
MTSAPLRVVVIDNDAVILDLFSALLTDDGFEPILCRKAADAVDCVRRAAPGAVLLDLHLGGPEQGVAVLEALKADAALRATPVVICTADYGAAAQHAGYFRQFGCPVVLKPFDLDEFLDVLRSVVASPCTSATADRRRLQERRRTGRPVVVERRSRHRRHNGPPPAVSP